MQPSEQEFSERQPYSIRAFRVAIPVSCIAGRILNTLTAASPHLLNSGRAQESLCLRFKKACCVVLFLERNGFGPVRDVDDSERTILAVAAGKVEDKEFCVWVRDHVFPDVAPE